MSSSFFGGKGFEFCYGLSSHLLCSIQNNITLKKINFGYFVFGPKFDNMDHHSNTLIMGFLVFFFFWFSCV